MKISMTLEFDDLEDRYELEMYQNIWKMRFSLSAGLEEIRRLLKHGEYSEETRMTLENVREVMCNELNGFDP